MGNAVLYEGPDLSKHNGYVNIQAIRDAGYGRVGLRAGYGNDNVDQRYEANAQACHRLGVRVLVYWFSYAFSVEMAKEEATFACDHAGEFWSMCPIAFDFEYDSVRYARQKGVDITKDLSTSMAIAFLKEVRNRGHIPVLYSNKDFLQHYFDLERIRSEVSDVRVWYARYAANLSPEEQEIADIWQYTSKGRAAGVTGNVDVNKFFIELDSKDIRREELPNINIRDFQIAANKDGFRTASGCELKEDGLNGEDTQYVCRKILLGAKKEGTKWQVGSRGALVRWWQHRCNEILESHNSEDGLFGRNTRQATIDLQKKLNLKPDGIVGYNSIHAAFYN